MDFIHTTSLQPSLLLQDEVKGDNDSVDTMHGQCRL